MRCTNPTRRRRGLGAALPSGVLLLAACGSPSPAPPTPPPSPPPPVATLAPAPVAPLSPPSLAAIVGAPTPSAVPTAPSAPSAQSAPPAAAAPRRVPLSPPLAARNWGEFKLQAARRLVQAHPDGSYLRPAPEPLLAIPVLEVELNADGSVRRVQVLRHPSQAKDTTQMAIDAVHRAAPYGSMAGLPRPWKWVEVFLFDDNRHFKPRELDK